MSEEQRAWATVAIVALYAMLLGVKLWPLWRRALRWGAVLCRRSAGEWLLLAALLFAAVHRGATKGTNGNGRASGLDPSAAPLAGSGFPRRRGNAGLHAVAGGKPGAANVAMTEAPPVLAIAAHA